MSPRLSFFTPPKYRASFLGSFSRETEKSFGFAWEIARLSGGLEGAYINGLSGRTVSILFTVGGDLQIAAA